MPRLDPHLRITNLEDGETVHQRCLLITGLCTLPDSNQNYIHVTTRVRYVETFPEQTWPTTDGHFKALAMLSTGLNSLQLSYVGTDHLEHVSEITVNYIPLLQCPPLHLAIMVASDSPCVIDCPRHKAGGISSTHSDLNAAVAKLRMTAYMWQAMIAEDMRLKGLGRRTFRLEDEWASDTVSRYFLNVAHDDPLRLNGAMRSTAKVHVVRSSKSVMDIQNPNCAQQNPLVQQKNDLMDYFLEALKDASGPFASDPHPVVAGLILDSHYNISQNLILGHASLHTHNRNGTSLGMFGSHLTYSWPRFLEEVTTCLTDTVSPGFKVACDWGDCTTMWEACALGQGAFLLEVGHAFGLPSRPGIRETGYYQDWPKHFLSKTADVRRYARSGVLVDDKRPNISRWDIADALALRMLPHFHLPMMESPPTSEQRDAIPIVQVFFDETEKTAPHKTLRITSFNDGLARITINGQHILDDPSWCSENRQMHDIRAARLEDEFDRTQPLQLRVLGTNGKETVVYDVWKLLDRTVLMQVAGDTVCLTKYSISSDKSAEGTRDLYEWTQLLREKGADGAVHRATSIDLRVGCLWDGGVVKYADDHTSHWGPMEVGGRKHRFGGHASEEIEIPAGVEITRIEINKGSDLAMKGVRMHLSNGAVAGKLNDEYDHGSEVVKLEPGLHNIIVGFFGKSEKTGCNGVVEFGIITVKKRFEREGLPETLYDMPELKNIAGILDEDEGVDDDHESDDEMKDDLEPTFAR